MTSEEFANAFLQEEKVAVVRILTVRRRTHDRILMDL